MINESIRVFCEAISISCFANRDVANWYFFEETQETKKNKPAIIIRKWRMGKIKAKVKEMVKI